MKKGLAIVLAAWAGAGLCASDPGHWNGGRTIPVHRLAPLDFDGEKVSPGAPLPAPISQGKTCGQCHDVAAARGGSHFRTGLDTNDAPASVQVEPWFWADEALGSPFRFRSTASPARSHRATSASRPSNGRRRSAVPSRAAASGAIRARWRRRPGRASAGS